MTKSTVGGTSARRTRVGSGKEDKSQVQQVVNRGNAVGKAVLRREDLRRPEQKEPKRSEE